MILVNTLEAGIESLGKNAILGFAGSGLVIKTMLLLPEWGDGSAYTWTFAVFSASWLGPLTDRSDSRSRKWRSGGRSRYSWTGNGST